MVLTGARLQGVSVPILGVAIICVDIYGSCEGAGPC